MTTMAPAGLVSGAVRQSLAYGLFSTFAIRPAGADRWESGVTWEAQTCDPADGIGQWQCAPGTTTGLPKNLDGNLPDDGEATPFTVYGHFQCSPVGWTPEQAQTRANEHLMNREEARVEQAFWTSDLGNIPSLQRDAGNVQPVPTTLGGGTLDVVAGLGALESFIAAGYGSTGVIHMTRATATALLSRYALVAKGGRLTTMLGTPVAAGAGYPGSGPAGQSAAAGTQWMFVTPAMFGYRSEVFNSSAVRGDLLDRSKNDLYAVAERNYVLGFDPCGVAAVLVDLD
jgi:hypothetical protein